jgi:hypothetical protein
MDAIAAAQEPQEETGLTVPLADRYGFPPFSVIDRRSGHWQKRKRKWNALGLDSSAGRPEGLLLSSKSLAQLGNPGQYDTLNSTSVFDPCLCELAYDWFSAPGARVLDPFTGGSVRGVVASRLGRPYTGLDLSRSQVEANYAQIGLADPECPPLWLQNDGGSQAELDDWTLPDGDRVREPLPEVAQHGADFVFSCPPYYDLESYSDGPADLSAMTYPEFLDMYGAIIAGAVNVLLPDRFAAWVISDVRDTRGYYRGLVADSIKAFEAAGARLYNDIIITDPVGSVAVRAARPFDSSRKVARLHQHMLVFVKGDPKRASRDLNCQIEAAEAPALGADAQGTLWGS